MANETYDCAIVGGGLAGLTLAIQLADSGRTVVLFEKEQYPFNKVCGEYISMESHSFLERLGLNISGFDIPYITELKVSAPNGNSFTRKLDLGGFGISRYTLDSQLAQIAVKKGVSLLEKTKVTDVTKDGNNSLVKANSQDYGARLVCGSFGKRASLERSLGRDISKGEKNYVAVKYHVKADLQANRIELHNFENGYCGISKVDGDKYCLCYLTSSENLSKSGNSIKEMEKNIVMQNPFLKKYFTESTFLCNEPVTISQVTFKSKSRVNNGVIMLGDASGTIAPLCGNGMSMAMRASYIAAGLINNFLVGTISRDQLYQQYQGQWNSNFSNRIKIGGMIQGLFGKNSLTNISIGFFKAFPFAADKVISMTHGETF
ncbi:MAG TPA: NAD(P)/FAD-dependent oxidoreductase [Bacteroidia bacterium]|jgi:flavin-dependent dehydrogenase|nr:NAD(P)/FAD-dependent oxidoreductase [Bacteroidia bacterium]